MEIWKNERIQGEINIFTTDSCGLSTRCGWVWIPFSGGVRQVVLEEAHMSKFSIHLVATQMYQKLRLIYWCPCMKKEIAWYMQRFLTCRMVKDEHHRMHGKLRPLEVPMWKWEQVTIDFITKLSRTSKGFNAIWVIMDLLTKSAHFLALKESSLAKKLADVYVFKIVLAMVCRCISSLTMMPGLLPSFSGISRRSQVRDCILALPIILRLMVKRGDYSED